MNSFRATDSTWLATMSGNRLALVDVPCLHGHNLRLALIRVEDIHRLRCMTTWNAQLPYSTVREIPSLRKSATAV